MKIEVEFSGGLELLFDKKKTHALEFADDKELTLRELVRWIKDHLLKERAELFYLDDSVRPGILVLINDCDWELLDGIEYKLQPNDNVVFISTLHGG